jgi:SAM-dependent methyltransferase
MAGAKGTEVESMCRVCGAARPRRVAEVFDGGRFVECSGCGIHFAEAPEKDLQAYYRAVWSDDNLGIAPYAAKVQAVRDPARLQRLLDQTPRFGWALAEARNLPHGAAVLDVGCGEGALLWGLRQQGLEAHGCDLAPPAVELARQLVGQERVHVGTIAEVPYRPGTFDCIIALEVIEHLPNPRPFLDCVTALLKPGGTLLLTTPNRHRVFAVLKRALGRPHSNTDYPPHHWTRWSAASLRGLLSRSFERTRVGSLRYAAEGPGGVLAAGALHLLAAGRMGQSLCARASGVRPEGASPSAPSSSSGTQAASPPGPEPTQPDEMALFRP